MWIKNIYLKDIQSYANAKMEFSKGINLIVGENNSGKSTIIKSLYKLQGNRILGVDNIRKGAYHGQIGIVVGDSKDYHFGKPDPKDNSVLNLPDSDEHLVIFNFLERTENSFYLNAKNNLLFSDSKHQHIRGFDSIGRSEDALQFNDFSSSEPHNFIYPFLSRRKTSHYSEATSEKASFDVSETLSSLPSKLALIVNPSHPEYHNFIKACNEILGFSIGSIPGSH